MAFPSASVILLTGLPPRTLTRMFNPYHDWLEIPPEDQPLTHYRLLGITPDETNPDVIREAALRQTSRVRVFQIGPQAEQCTRILNEIAQARAILTNPKSRQEYDAHLATPPSVETPVAATLAAPSIAERSPTVPEPSTPRPPFPWPRPDRLVAAAGYGLLLLAGFAISFCLTFQSLRTSARQAPDPPQNPAPSAPGDQEP
jgi:hypothetical protein